MKDTKESNEFIGVQSQQGIMCHYVYAKILFSVLIAISAIPHIFLCYRNFTLS